MLVLLFCFICSGVAILWIKKKKTRTQVSRKYDGVSKEQLKFM